MLKEEGPFQHCCQPGQSEMMGLTRLVSWPLLNTPLSFVTPFCFGTFHALNSFYLHDQMYLLYEPGLRMTVWKMENNGKQTSSANSQLHGSFRSLASRKVPENYYIAAPEQCVVHTKHQISIC